MPNTSTITLCATLLLYAANASAQIESTQTEPVEYQSRGVLSKKQVRNIFLGKRQTWDDGQRMVIASLKEGTTHVQFLKEWVGMTPNQFRTHWRKRVFTGKGTMPTWLQTEQEQRSFIQSTPGAIGYQRRSQKRATRKGPVFFDPKTARYVEFETRLKRRS